MLIQINNKGIELALIQQTQTVIFWIDCNLSLQL